MTTDEEKGNHINSGVSESIPARLQRYFTLLYAIGQEAFLKAIQEADCRRIVIYHVDEDKDTDDAPMQWKYSKEKESQNHGPRKSIRNQ